MNRIWSFVKFVAPSVSIVTVLAVSVYFLDTRREVERDPYNNFLAVVIVLTVAAWIVAKLIHFVRGVEKDIYMPSDGTDDRS